MAVEGRSDMEAVTIPWWTPEVGIAFVTLFAILCWLLGVWIVDELAATYIERRERTPEGSPVRHRKVLGYDRNYRRMVTPQEDCDGLSLAGNPG